MFSFEIEEKFHTIKKKVYYSFYKLLQSEEWEEILFDKIIETNNSKDFFLYYFFKKGTIDGLSFKEDIKEKYTDMVQSLFQEIDW